MNRLNVAITRARCKSVVFLPRPLLESLPRVLDNPDAERGLAFMRNLVTEAARQLPSLVIDLGEEVRAIILRANHPLSG